MQNLSGEVLSASCTPLRSSRQPHAGHISLVDHAKRLMLPFSPKGGATVAAQMFYRYEGVYEVAYAYNKWIHEFRLQVFNKQPVHAPVRCAKVCTSGWTCVWLVRQPLDRVVSSYQFALSGWKQMAAPWNELTQLKLKGGNADDATESMLGMILATTTFEEFIMALSKRAQTRTTSQADDHFMPQLSTWRDSDRCNGTPDAHNQSALPVYYVPVECLDGSLIALEHAIGVGFNATGLTSSHYNHDKVHASREYADVTSWPFERVKVERPPYELFTSQNLDIARRTCCLFSDDICMYRRACKQKWLQHGTCVAECSRQLARLAQVCGELQCAQV